MLDQHGKFNNHDSVGEAASMTPAIKGLFPILTPSDIGQIIARPTRYVIRSLLRCGVIPSIREGARGWQQACNAHIQASQNRTINVSIVGG